ncbi:MAG TPA: hypothetical protein VMT18_02765, partial [Planctomycetota bacterium]|nr:hypothetical protein [Planctomycetota bacterium]
QAAVAALVLPGDARITRDLKPRIQEVLGSITGEAGASLADALDGPQGPGQLAQAIFMALAQGYPREFHDIEKPGGDPYRQRIRFPHEVLDADPDRRHGATCVDYALLACAAGEACGLDPLFVQVGCVAQVGCDARAACHAMVGYWSDGSRAEHALLTDAEALERHVRAGELTVFDVTELARSRSFTLALESGATLRRQPWRLLYAVDIAAARLEHGIAPLPSPTTNGGDPPGAAHLRADWLRRVYERASRVALDTIDPAAGGGETTDTSLALGAVYTALLTTEPRGEDAPASGHAMTERRSAIEQLDRHDRLVLLGAAGSGKSTFVDFVSACLAGESLGGQRDLDVARLTAPLPGDDGGEGRARQPWHHGALLPLPVVLRDFAAKGLPAPGERASASHLWGFIEGMLADARLGDFAPALEHELRTRGALVLLDGLDEVPDAGRRREQVVQAVANFAANFGKCRLLVTCRPYAYEQPGWRLAGFATATLADFTDGQVRRFVRAWHADWAQRRGDERAGGYARRLEQAIFSEPRLHELARRPLLLTLMASLHARRGGGLPARREELYHESVPLLLERWEAQRTVVGPDGAAVVIQPSLAAALKAGQDEIRRVIAGLAYEAHAAQPRQATPADIAGERIEAALLSIRRSPDVRPLRVLEYLRDRAGILLPRGEDVYTFPHRSIQEYLAACHLTASEDFPDDLAELAREDPDCWREVTLLAAAKASRGAASNLWNLADALCPEQPPAEAGDEPPASDLAGALLAGQALAESAEPTPWPSSSHAPQAGQQRRSQRLARIRAWQGAIVDRGWLSERDRALAGDSLARLGDERDGVGLIRRRPGDEAPPAGEGLPQIAWCERLIPPGAVTLEHAAGTFTVKQGVQIARYPVTWAQF